MASYKGHLVAGVLAYGALLAVLSTEPSIFLASRWFIWCLAGALFPDVDIKSKGHNIFYFLSFCALLFFIFQGRFQLAALFSAVAMVPLIVGHRGIFHRFWFLAFIAVFVFLLLPVYLGFSWRAFCTDMLFFLVGAASHLWLDFGIRRMFRW